MLANFDMTPLSDASGITSCPDWDAAGVQATVAQIQTRDYSTDLLVAPAFISDSPQSQAPDIGRPIRSHFLPPQKNITIEFRKISIYQVNWVKVLLASLTTNTDILGKPG